MQEFQELAKKCSLFEHVDLDMVTSILKHAQKLRFEKGEKIIEQGTTGQGFYVIAEGNVKVILEISPQEAVELSVLSVGDVLGEMGLLIDTPRTATVLASEEVLIYYIDGNDIKKYLAEHNVHVMQMINNLAKILAKRLYQCNQFLSTLWTERNNIEYLQQALQNSKLLLSKVLV